MPQCGKYLGGGADRFLKSIVSSYWPGASECHPGAFELQEAIW